jgi:uncharacterized protein
MDAGAMGYLRRVADDELDALLPALPAIAIEGAKGVGKTATAERRAATVYRLDDRGQRSIAEADPGRLATGPTPILIDEWQRLPTTWDVVRRAVDADRAAGRFLLTGSATPVDAPTHSGAGRIVTLRMRPLTLAERGIGRPTVSLAALLSGSRPAVVGTTDVGLEDYAREITVSGLPGLRGLPERAIRAQLDGYLGRIVEHDFPELGRTVRNPAALRRWMTAYAAASSSTASYETIRDAATGGHGEKPAKTTTAPYNDILQRLWIVEPVPAWLPTANRIARLASPPRHQLADPALAARLLGVDVDGLLAGREHGLASAGGTLLGALFESLATLSVRVFAQAAEGAVSHLRTRGGEREVDLIVEGKALRILALEVKLGRTVGDADVRHLHWLRDQIGDSLLDAVVLTTGTEAYRRSDGIAVVPLALLGP